MKPGALMQLQLSMMVLKLADMRSKDCHNPESSLADLIRCVLAMDDTWDDQAEIL